MEKATVHCSHWRMTAIISIYLFYLTYTVYLINIFITPFSLCGSKHKNKGWLFGMAGEGGFTLDVFLGLFFDMFLAKTEL
jgi:hypothetical protein